MRSRSWCRGLLLLVLAGCGGSPAHRSADPFAYDAKRPLSVQQSGIAHPNKLMSVHVLSFSGASGRVDAFVLVPNEEHGRLPAVLFLHGAGGNREDFLVPAAILTERRALDLLSARSDVDPKRLGLVGYSLGAQTAAILAGDDPRLKAVGIVAGRGTDVTTYWIRRSHTHLYFQAGTLD